MEDFVIVLGFFSNVTLCDPEVFVVLCGRPAGSQP